MKAIRNRFVSVLALSVVAVLAWLVVPYASADLLVSSGNFEVRRYSDSGVFISTFVTAGSGGLEGPYGLAFGPDGNLYIISAATANVKRYNGTTGAFIDTFASGGGLSAPFGLVFGPDGNLYVSSSTTATVKRYNGTTGAFIDDFVSGGGPDGFNFLIFTPTTAQSWIQLSPTGTPPSARHGLGAGYDAVNDRLIFFSGDQSLAVQYPTDVWVLINATGISGEPTWLQVVPQNQGPVGTFAGTVAYDPTSNRLIVFGGCGGNCQPEVNQVWVLTNANGLGGIPEWIRLPDAPIYRAEHAAVYDPASNRLIMFGGHEGWYASEQTIYGS